MKSCFGFLAVAVAACLLGCGKKGEKHAGPVVLVGIDGAEWKIIDELFDQNKMPNLRKLVKNGVRADLETIDPILSPIIWTTIATGKEPREHGINNFVQHDDMTDRQVPISSFQRRSKALWNIASNLGLRTAFVGWWASWPAEKINGTIVSDHLAYHGFGLSSKSIETKEGIVHPPEQASEISSMVVAPSSIEDKEILQYMHLSPEELATRQDGKLDFANPLHHFEFALATNHTYEKIANRLLSTQKPDLIGVYLEMVDSVSHLFMKYVPPPVPGLSPELTEKFKDVVYRTYERQDEVLGTLIESAGPKAAFVIVSDHGFKTKDRRLVELAHTDIKQAHLWHEKKGILVLSGPQFEKGIKLERASVYDIAPTVLYALGEKAARDMKGGVLEPAFSAEFRNKHPLLFVDSYEDSGAPKRSESLAQDTDSQTRPRNIEVDKAVMDRLAALGYVERLDGKETMIKSVQSKIQSGDLDGASGEVDSLLKKYGEDLDARMTAAEVADRRGKTDQALEHYRAASKIACDPKFKDKSRCGDTLVRSAAALIQKEAYEEAEKILKQIGSIDQKKADFWYLSALVIEGRGDRKRAYENYEKAIAVNPVHVFSLNNAAGYLAETGKLEKAKQYYTTAAALEPGHLESRFNLGMISLQEKRYKEADGYFAAALKLRPEFVQAYFPKIQAEIAAGMTDEASVDFLKYKNLEKDQVPLLIIEAELAAARGDTVLATELRGKAIAINPDAANSFMDRIK